MTVTRTTEHTIFEMKTYANGGGWKWEVAYRPMNGDEPPMRRVSIQPFVTERIAFEDGRRHLDWLLGAVE